MAAHLSPLSHTSPATAASVAAVATATLPEIAQRLRQALREVVGHRALLIFTEDCTGRPQKKAGDPEITEHASILELEDVRRRLASGEDVRTARIGGQDRPVLALAAPTGAILVLCEPDAEDAAALEDTTTASAYVRIVWEMAATRIRQQVSDASPAYLVESRAASAERLRVTTELTESHATDLESLLALLRNTGIDDRRARAAAVELATTALVHAKTRSDVVVALTEEPVASAFERLRADLRPLTRFGRLDVQFVEPPADGRALPGEVAHAARAIVRSAVLAFNDQPDTTRVRIQWDCDGTNLLIKLRDDGAGALDGSVAELRQVQARVSILGGRAELTGVPGWGSEIDVTLPLDAPPPATSGWDLAPRERDVLRLIAAGQRNRQIATTLGISENTVKFHTSHLYRKLGVSSRAAAAAAAIASGLR
ncbi:LuxR C-terminal-related transcriptional regulator [Microbacterium betulae]|uniref:LuxR C-terminal-related transcriptional regulator n=1 Tax=Microbacterium betulae TaxID=2981139 RepID=A0AA97FJK6_9MICO|nr:LuxR C-terminal-related transcriptional regulator [Microbacterium sp. AB]WOF23465.1 LuxR C-terminal-related transcriptional regulator [Microbacterium sp. AB]